MIGSPEQIVVTRKRSRDCHNCCTHYSNCMQKIHRIPIALMVLLRLGTLSSVVGLIDDPPEQKGPNSRHHFKSKRPNSVILGKLKRLSKFLGTTRCMQLQ